MHELAIAGYLRETVLRCAAGRRVTRVRVRVGRLRQVVPASLRFSWDLVVEGTPAAGAELSIEPVEVRTRCRACGADSEQRSFPMRCGGCGGDALDAVAGEELVLDWLECEVPEEVGA